MLEGARNVSVCTQICLYIEEHNSFQHRKNIRPLSKELEMKENPLNKFRNITENFKLLDLEIYLFYIISLFFSLSNLN